MTRNTIHARLAVLIVAAVAAASCSSSPAEHAASLTPPFLETPVAPRPASSAATVPKGKQVYDANCTQCHGVDGKGDG